MCTTGEESGRLDSHLTGLAGGSLEKRLDDIAADRERKDAAAIRIM